MDVYEIRIIKKEITSYTSKIRLQPYDFLKIKFKLNLDKVISENSYSKNSICPIYTSEQKLMKGVHYQWAN